jgi:hypothetical protein
MKITIKSNDFTEFPADWIDSIPTHGSADTAISQIMMYNTVNCDRTAAINYLAGIGYDDSEELEVVDDETLTSRVLWIALLDCRENESTEWYMGN